MKNKKNKRLKEKNIQTKLLFHNSLREWKKNVLEVYDNIEVRFTESTFEELTSTLVFDEYIAIIVYSERPFGIYIESKQVADSYKQFFHLIWNNAKKE